MDLWFLLFPSIVLAVLAWRWFRYRSFTGALLGVRILEEVGEIELESQPLSSRRLKIYVVQETPQDVPEVAIAIVSKAALGASLMPVRLSKFQARDLVAMLDRACREDPGKAATG